MPTVLHITKYRTHMYHYFTPDLTNWFFNHYLHVCFFSWSPSVCSVALWQALLDHQSTDHTAKSWVQQLYLSRATTTATLMQLHFITWWRCRLLCCSVFLFTYLFASFFIFLNIVLCDIKALFSLLFIILIFLATDLSVSCHVFLSRWMGLLCRADTMAYSEEKFFLARHSCWKHTHTHTDIYLHAHTQTDTHT